MNLERTVIALGFFDGVHRGHGALLQKTVQRAGELGAIPAVFTFDRPPKEVVTGRPMPLINSPEDRADLEVDTDLIEQRIYERQALLCRYRYLLARARELGLHTVLTKYQPAGQV